MHNGLREAEFWVWQTCHCTLSGLLERRHDVGLYEPRSIVRNFVSRCKVTMKKEGWTLIAQKGSRRFLLVTLVVSCGNCLTQRSRGLAEFN